MVSRVYALAAKLDSSVANMVASKAFCSMLPQRCCYLKRLAMADVVNYVRKAIH